MPSSGSREAACVPKFASRAKPGGARKKLAKKKMDVKLYTDWNAPFTPKPARMFLSNAPKEKFVKITGKLVLASIIVLSSGYSKASGENIISEGERLEALSKYDDAYEEYYYAYTLGNEEALIKMANAKISQIECSAPNHTNYLHSSYRLFLEKANEDAETALFHCKQAKEAGCTNGLQTAIERVSSCKAMIADIEEKISMAEQKELARKEAERIAKEEAEERERKAREKAEAERKARESPEYYIGNNIPLEGDAMREVIRCLTYRADSGNKIRDAKIEEQVRNRYMFRTFIVRGKIKEITTALLGEVKIIVRVDGGTISAIFDNMPREEAMNLDAGDEITFIGQTTKRPVFASFAMDWCKLLRDGYDDQPPEEKSDNRKSTSKQETQDMGLLEGLILLEILGNL